MAAHMSKKQRTSKNSDYIYTWLSDNIHDMIFNNFYSKALLFISLLIFLLLPGKLLMAQHQNSFCYQPPEWENLILVDGLIPDSLESFLVITNRPYAPEQEEGIFFPNDIASYRRVTYLQIACSGNKWLVKRLSNVEEALAILKKDRDLLLYVHGHGKSFPHSIQRAWKIQKRYDISVILFDWPAKNNNFNTSLSRVRKCNENLYNLLLQLKSYRSENMAKNQKLSLLAHSLGNYFLTHYVVNGSWQYLQEPFIDNMILNAPAVRSKEHGDVLSHIRFAHNKYVILNKNDKILRGAHLLTSGKMLGNIVIEPIADNTNYLHFTEIAGSEHNYFAGYHEFEDRHPVVYPLYYELIHGKTPDLGSPYFDNFKPRQFMILPKVKK